MNPNDGGIHGYQTASKNSYGIMKLYAAENRKNMTWAEKCLWARLGRNKYKIKFRRQHVIGDFIADFVCLSCKLIIEVDGAYHAELRQYLNDTNRTFDLNNSGFTVLRLSNEEVTSNPDSAAEKIYSKVFELLEEKQAESDTTNILT